MGIGKADTVEEVARKVAQGVEIRNNHEVVFHLQQAVPEFLYMISANADLVMESKARWDAGGKELYGQKVVGTGPFEFVERKVGSHVLYKRVEKHWRQTPGLQRTGVPLGARERDAPGHPHGGRGAHRRYRPRPCSERP